MPISLSIRVALTKKQYSLLILFLVSPLFFYAQTLTGLWIGSLSNDSTTSRKDQSFEIALTEYKGKVYGYSRSEFIVNDTLYYIVKRVKGTIVPAATPGEEDLCEVIDEEIVAYNFRGKLDKGIKVTSTFRRNESDSAWHLDGKWKTNATKKYYAVTGKVGLAEEKDLSASKIFPHLEELNLANDIAFYKERIESIPVVKFAKPEKNTSGLTGKSIDVATVNITAAKPDLERAESDYIKTVEATEKTNSVAKNNTINIASVNMAPAKPALQRAESDYIKTVAATEKTTNTNAIDLTKNKIPTTKNTIKQPQTQLAKTDSKASAPEIMSEDFSMVAKTNIPPKGTTNIHAEKTTTNATGTQKPANPINKNATPQQQSVATAKVNTPIEASLTNKPAANSAHIKNIESTGGLQKTAMGTIASNNTVSPEVKKPVIDVTVNAAVIAGRKSEFSQGVSFKSDSLVIALYDNGEIDGDTVSVYMNGEIIMSRQGLKASAIKKTIHITPGNEDFSLVLFADNLGKYPPNTGLLVVTDGDDTYNLRFSSDFTKNAGIVFRRKK